MALLDGYDSFFGQTGSPQAMRDKEINDLVMRLRMAQSGPSPKSASEIFKNDLPFSGIAIDRTPRAAQMPQTMAPSADSRYLETTKQAMPTNRQRRIMPDQDSMPVGAKRQDRLRPEGGVSTMPKSAAGTSRQDMTPSTPPDFSPTLGERISNFGDALTGRSYVNFSDQTRQRNSTYQALREMGLSDDMARAAVLNPNLLQSILKSRYGRAGAYGKQIFWAQDKDTKEWLPFQVSSEGIGSPTKLPENVRAVPPGDIAQQQSQGREYGKGVGEARVSLPTVMNNSAAMIQTIDAALNDPALSLVTGPVGGLTPNISGRANRAQSRINQILGKTFLEAFNSLRGGGQITEAEGRKATDALARISTQRMGDADYKQAIRDLRDGIIDMVNASRRKARLPDIPKDAFKSSERLQEYLKQDFSVPEKPPAPNAIRSPKGWVIPDPNNPGKWLLWRAE